MDSATGARYTLQMPLLRRVFRTGCALLALLGLGVSGLEGVACNDLEDGAAFHAESVITRAAGHAGPSGNPAPQALPCCPCIHSYPVALRALSTPTPVIVAYPVVFAHAGDGPLNRSPEPLVPPPIV